MLDKLNKLKRSEIALFGVKKKFEMRFLVLTYKTIGAPGYCGMSFQ